MSMMTNHWMNQSSFDGTGSLPDLPKEDCYGEGEEDPPDENASPFKVGRKAK